MPAAIAIRGVTKSYPAASRSGAPTVAVDGVSLEVGAGELFFLLGPSGCGKTTLLRMIAGFIDPTAGRILIGGRDVTDVPPNARGTGMMFQSYALWPHMTVAANVGFGLTVRRVARAEAERRIGEALRSVRMEAYADRRPNQLSGGQQQRVALARALVVRPDVLLLDEPLSNLDAKLRVELRDEIRRVCRDAGITGVYVTHDQKEALSMADRVAVMDRGRVVQIGTPRELYRAPSTRFVASFLGEANFLPGRLLERTAGTLVVETPAGRLASTAPPPPEGALPREVTVSIRPEALRIVPAGPGSANTLTGTVIDSVYLGEMVQHAIRLGGAGDIVCKVAELNPAPGAAPRDVRLHVEPADVVVVDR